LTRFVCSKVLNRVAPAPGSVAPIGLLKNDTLFVPAAARRTKSYFWPRTT
jgi:hypothetical protein